MKSLVIFICSFLVFIYFAYHFACTHVSSNPLQDLEETFQHKQKVLANLKEKERQWQYKVQALKPESLDPDVAEESIRYVLHKGHPNEETVLIS